MRVKWNINWILKIEQWKQLDPAGNYYYSYIKLTLLILLLTWSLLFCCCCWWWCCCLILGIQSWGFNRFLFLGIKSLTAVVIEVRVFFLKLVVMIDFCFFLVLVWFCFQYILIFGFQNLEVTKENGRLLSQTKLKKLYWIWISWKNSILVLFYFRSYTQRRDRIIYKM